MTNEPRFWAVLFIGPPGSGKDTQSDLLATELGLVELKTSKLLDEAFAKADLNDAEIREQIKRKTSGGLVDSAFTEKLVVNRIRQEAATHEGIVMSGSPRTIGEAQTEFPVLDELYGRDCVKVINIHVSQEESVKRNSSRRVCKSNNHPIPNLPEYQNITACPKDGSPIETRQDDAPDTIKHRYRVYETETAPVFDFLKEKGYNIIQINGEQTIEDVHRDILNHLW